MFYYISESSSFLVNISSKGLKREYRIQHAAGTLYTVEQQPAGCMLHKGIKVSCLYARDTLGLFPSARWIEHVWMIFVYGRVFSCLVLFS